MGNTLRKPFFKVRRRSVDGCSNSTEYVYVDTIRDANFSWLEGRRVSADDYYPLTREVKETDRVAILMHDIFKYMLKGNAKTPLTSIKRCLHIGSGHYIWLVEMANDNKEIQFEGFDMKPKDINIPLPTNVTFTHGNIFEDGLPYPDEHFDYINVRSLLAWLPKEKISFVLKEARRVLRRGGWIEILELDAFVKNGTSYYEDNLGMIWKDYCNCKGYDPNNIIGLGKFLEGDFSEIKTSKLSIPVGYGGKIGELYAEVFVTATNTLASGMMDKLNMTSENIQEYLQKCIKGLTIKQSYTNVYLVTATRNFV